MSLLLTDEPDSTIATNTSGPNQGVIEQARRRQRRRQIAAVVIGVLGIATAGVLIAVPGGRSPGKPPLRLPPESPLPTRHPAAGSISVSVSPNLEGGQAGWCVMILEGSGGESGTCGPLPTYDHPLLTSTSGWSSGSHYVTTIAITAPRVAGFLVGANRRVATKPLPELPYGLRVVDIHTPLPRSAKPSVAGLTSRPPALISLDVHGRPITESSDYGAVWFRDWNRPAAQLKGPCELRVSGLSGVTADWGQIATALRPYPHPILGRGFLSCIDTEYYLAGAGRGIRASVLLDAVNPDKTAPAPIPGMVPIPHLAGFYNDGPGQGSPMGPMTAERQGDTWVVAAGGGRNAELARVQLLQHLRASVKPTIQSIR